MERIVFTNPVNIPMNISYVATNPFDLVHFSAWMRWYGSDVKEVLYGSGVHTIFRNSDRLEYPPSYINRYISGLIEASKIIDRYAPGARLWYVIPDVPADYPGREHLYPHNVAKTIEYILLFKRRYIDKLPGTPVAVVQGGLNKPDSVVKTYLSHKDVYDDFELIALGNMCRSRAARLVAREIALFDRVADRPYHAFGVHTNALKVLVRWKIGICKLRSIDSTSYWWDIHYRHGRGKTREEMARIAEMRISKLKRLLDQLPCYADITRYLHLGDDGSDEALHEH